MSGPLSIADDLKPGVVVFGRVKGHPWWPGVVAVEPKSSNWLKEAEARVWCQFFNDTSGAWLRTTELRPFDAYNCEECMVVNRGNARHRRFIDRLTAACKTASQYAREFPESNVGEIRSPAVQSSAPWADEEYVPNKRLSLSPVLSIFKDARRECGMEDVDLDGTPINSAPSVAAADEDGNVAASGVPETVEQPEPPAASSRVEEATAQDGAKITEVDEPKVTEKRSRQKSQTESDETPDDAEPKKRLRRSLRNSDSKAPASDEVAVTGSGNSAENASKEPKKEVVSRAASSESASFAPVQATEATRPRRKRTKSLRYEGVDIPGVSTDPNIVGGSKQPVGVAEPSSLQKTPLDPKIRKPQKVSSAPKAVENRGSSDSVTLDKIKAVGDGTKKGVKRKAPVPQEVEEAIPSPPTRVAQQEPISTGSAEVVIHDDNCRDVARDMNDLTSSPHPVEVESRRASLKAASSRHAKRYPPVSKSHASSKGGTDTEMGDGEPSLAVEAKSRPSPGQKSASPRNSRSGKRNEKVKIRRSRSAAEATRGSFDDKFLGKSKNALIVPGNCAGTAVNGSKPSLKSTMTTVANARVNGGTTAVVIKVSNPSAEAADMATPGTNARAKESSSKPADAPKVSRDNKHVAESHASRPRRKSGQRPSPPVETGAGSVVGVKGKPSAISTRLRPRASTHNSASKKDTPKGGPIRKPPKANGTMPGRSASCASLPGGRVLPRALKGVRKVEPRVDQPQGGTSSARVPRDDGDATDSEVKPGHSLLPVSGSLEYEAEARIFGIGRVEDGKSGPSGSEDPVGNANVIHGDMLRRLLQRVSDLEADVKSLKGRAAAEEQFALGEDTTAAGLKSAVEALAAASVAFARRRDHDSGVISRALGSLWPDGHLPLTGTDGEILRAMASSLVMAQCRKHHAELNASRER